MNCGGKHQALDFARVTALPRALTTGNLQVIESAAAELTGGLDAVPAILVVLAQTSDPRFDRAAARWSVGC